MQARAEPGRSQRDELERLQGELREVRRKREELPRENAELAAEVARLEQELDGLRRSVEEACAQARRPAPSLPETLEPPFVVLPSRRTAYGRLRFALRMLSVTPLPFIGFGVSGLGPRFAVLAMFLLASVVLLHLLQWPEDDDGPTWRFGEEELSPVPGSMLQGRVRYSEVTKVEVRRGWLQRRFGLGSVRVTWTPGAPTHFGARLGSRDHVVTIALLDEPERLAGWLRARTSGKEAERVD